MRRAIPAFIFLIFAAISLFAQSNEQTVPSHLGTKISLSKNKNSPDFINARTVVTQVELQGLDTDDETYGFQSEEGIYKSDFLSNMRGEKTWVVEGQKFDTERVGLSLKILKAWLAARGYLKAEVVVYGTKLSSTTMRLTFSVNRGIPLDPPELIFLGSEHIENQEFVDDFKSCAGNNWKPYDNRKYQYYTQQCSRKLLFSRGFFQAKINRVTAKLVGNRYSITFDIRDGTRYRWGDIKIEGAREFSKEKILAMFGQKMGEVADAKNLQDFVYDKLKSEYEELGYVQYAAEFEPEFLEPKIEGMDGIVNIAIDIDEGRQYKLNRIQFVGIDADEQKDLMDEFPLKPGDIYVRSKAEAGIETINKLGIYLPADKDQDVEIRVSEELGKIDLVIKLRKDK